MLSTHIPIYLVSKSPRRRRLLSLLNINFDSLTIEFDEKINPFLTPEENALSISVFKMNIAEKMVQHGIILTADTIVVLDKQILGKPRDEEDSIRMLKLLSGKKHTVITGFCLKNMENNKKICDFEKTDVYFRELGNEEIIRYAEKGSPLDKAGGYGIQDDFGAVFINRIDGCFYNVVGLPLSKVYLAFKEIL